MRRTFRRCRGSHARRLCLITSIACHIPGNGNAVTARWPSPSPALPYQHASDVRDRVLAGAIAELATGSLVRLGLTEDGGSSASSNEEICSSP